MPVTKDVQSVEVRFVVPDASLPSHVRLSLHNGDSVLTDCKADRKRLGTGRSRSLRLAIDSPTDQFLTLRIETDRVHVPSWASGSDDERRLGVGVQSVEFL